MRHLNSERTIAQQMVAIGHERLVQGLAQDQTTEAGAIDDELNRVRAVFLKRQRRDIAPLIKRHIDNIVADIGDPERRAKLFKIIAKQRRIEVIGVLADPFKIICFEVSRRPVRIHHGRQAAHAMGEGGLDNALFDAPVIMDGWR